MRIRGIFCAFLIAAQAASAALVVRPGPSAVGASAAAAAAIPAGAVPRWTATFDAFLASPSPDAASVRAIALILAAARPDDPALAPLAQALQKAAAPLLARPVHAKSTQADLEAADLKFEVLNYPSVRALLSEEQQSRAGAAAWALSRNVWTKDDDHWVTRKRAVEKTIAAVLRELEAERPAAAEEPYVAGPGPDVAVEVLKGDIRDARADAVLTTVQRKRLCGGGVNAAIKEANGCFAAQLRKAPRLEDGQALLARGDGKGPIDNVLFVADKYEKPLSDIVLEGLKAADRAGLKSIAVPALRTGSVFGAVERTYQEVVAELRKGVQRFLAGARTSLERISFVVHNDEKLASGLQGAFNERERSLRTDLREAKLSGKGFVLTPREAKVPDRASPVYGSLLEPWSLKHLLVPHKPVKIGEIEDKAAFSKPVTSVLNMPVKMPGTEIKVPEELGQFREFLQKIIDHEKAVNPELDDFYMYLTVDHGAVKAGSTHRRPGIHIDGVQGARYKVKLPPEHLYSASDRLGTVFYDQPFDLTKLDPARQHVHAELERQAKEANARATPDFDIAFWDSYSVHRADVAKEDFMRTFIRVEFSKKQYDSEGDTHNPLFEYDWKPVARPIPADLDDAPLPPGGFTAGYDDELKDLAPDQPHTVKDLPKWVKDNIGTTNSKRYFLVEGDSQEARLTLETDGWTLREPYSKETGFHQVYDATTPNGETVNLILGVNGASRVIHLQSFLKLAGVPAERVFTRRGFRSWKPEYKAAFEALGHVPDLVVYGLTRPAVRALIGDAPELEEFWKDFNAKKSEPGPQNDISRRPMKALELADGRKVWFFMPLFGELAGDLMEALLDHGARSFAVMSAAGSLDPDSNLGDWFTPRAGSHLTMPTSNTQTMAWAEEIRARGVRTVDMEHAHLAAALAARPDAAATIDYLVSDVMTGPRRTDLTETRIGAIPGLVEKAGGIIARALGLRPGVLPARSAANVFFPTR